MRRLLLLGFLLFGGQVWAIVEKSFVVVIPSYNNAQWYQKNLDSVFNQNYSNYRIIYVDDASEDGTGDLVEQYLALKKMQNRTILVKNNYRKGQLFNRYKAIHDCADDEIVVLLDGDDWLANDQVLSYLNELYSDETTLMTVGNACYSSNGKKIGYRDHTQKEIEQFGFRQLGFRGVHPRTFYAGVFKKIKAEDLMHQGLFFMVATDVAFMMPIFEMTQGRYQYIHDILYVYNNQNPINLFKSKLARQIYFDLLTRNRKYYQKLDKEWQPLQDQGKKYTVSHLLFIEEEQDGAEFYKQQKENGIMFDTSLRIAYADPYRSLRTLRTFHKEQQLNIGYPIDKIYQFRVNFKKQLLELLQTCTSEYLLVSTEQLLKETEINLHEVVSKLQVTGSFGALFGKSNKEYLEEHAYDVAGLQQHFNLYLCAAWNQYKIFEEVSDNYGFIIKTQEFIKLLESMEVFHANYYTLLSALNSVIKQDNLILVAKTEQNQEEE